MSITFSCPNPTCRAKMTVPDSVAGKRGKCTKCQKMMTVPTETEPPPAAKSPPPPRVDRPVVSLPEMPRVDADAAAADVFADGPEVAEKTAELIEFNCPQCDEPLKMAIDMGGKRTPCPECRRIISVPMPKKGQKTSWRDTGPNLPSGAKREEQAAPEGAWDGKSSAVGTEALQEAGVIKEKFKPLTLLQKTGPYLVVGTPVLILVFGGFFLWQYFSRVSEKKALDTALASAKSDAGRRALGSDGLIAVHGYAGKYYLRSKVRGGANTPGAATLAREQYLNAASIAGSGHSLAGDTLLGEIALWQLDLEGTPVEIADDQKLKWSDTQKIIVSTLGKIHSRSGKLAGLRGVVAGLVASGHTAAVLLMTNALYPNEGAERSEAIAVAGLELLHLGKKDEATKAYDDAAAPFANKKTRPALSASVVALAVALGRKPVPADDEPITDSNQRGIGTADGLARLGQLGEARKEAEVFIKSPTVLFQALVALADGAFSTKQGEAADLDAALAGVRAGAPDWVYLRLVELSLDADIDAARIEPVVVAITDSALRAWARLLIYRKRLTASKAIEGEDGLSNLPPTTLGGRVARLEMAWHNTRRDGGWGKAVNGWDEAPKAFGSLGVALGMQGK